MSESKAEIRKVPPPQPLAQTFSIPTTTNDNSAMRGADDGDFKGGVFLTSVDLFFFGKDELLPVTLEIRETNFGYPSLLSLPFSSVTLNSEDVNTSTEGDVATTFTFSSPVYIQETVEYAVVVTANTAEYSLFVARMGEPALLGGKLLDKQPLMGNFFKSSNNRSFSISPMEDLKIRIKCAKFDISANGNIVLNNDAISSKILKQNPLTFTHGNTALKVTHKDHGMYNTANNVTISDASAGLSTTLASGITSTATTLTLTSGTNFNLAAGKWSKTADATPRWYIKIDDEIMYYTAISDTAVSSLVRAQNNTAAASHSAGATVEFYQLHKVPLTEVNATHTTLGNLDIDSYSITLTTSPAFDGGSGSSSENGGSDVKASENHVICTGFTNMGILEFPETSLTAKLRPTSATSVSGSETSFTQTAAANAISIPLNDNYNFDNAFMVASEINETNEMGGDKSYIKTMTMASERNNLSPVIDSKRMSWVSVANRINNIDSASDLASNLTYVPSTDPDGDNNAAIYMTKKVILENPATALKVLLTANRPAAAEIKLLFRILGTEDSIEFDDLEYTFFNTDGSSDRSVNPSLGQNDFQEYEYSAGVTDDGIGTPLTEFISFSIKIVMQSTNMAAVPRIGDLRAIALAI